MGSRVDVPAGVTLGCPTCGQHVQQVWAWETRVNLISIFDEPEVIITLSLAPCHHVVELADLRRFNTRSKVELRGRRPELPGQLAIE